MHALLITITAAPLAAIIIWIRPHALSYWRACRVPEHED
jgi:hypothetical protein